MDILIDKEISDFIKSLNKEIIAKVLRVLDLLEEFNYKLPLPHSKPLGKGLFELRIRGSQEVRLFYIFYNNNIIILHGIVKKSNQIPKKEINLAYIRKKELT
ncbi:type II toxin-antitoxin system RelE/ParE family toxin [bacterium]|jgi:phage-related protein|nr:type II toxin-antitoxin system RelE/ParE family toxin [bacterium]MBT4121843.1 type II toxin-antitoxin system RelE/ParE family toxin [bacterium]MBT4335590.1 type II toxin-antitoxin system RelE/ParE family toxin [bacterium]MBT4495587.1 type II toxin-antitoxin system RelE/ParE family toxin [bacterium]MBT4764245.1 type II toxin-antitoxin system RelE/ParE family toxin [bacterium]